jgi:hypothetical protein
MSSFEKYFAPFKSTTKSSIVGMMCLVRKIALFGARMSTHTLSFPGCFGFGTA